MEGEVKMKSLLLVTCGSFDMAREVEQLPSFSQIFF
jgi:hypothetical protein